MLTRNTRKAIFFTKNFRKISTDKTYSYAPTDIVAEFKEFHRVLTGGILRVDKSLLIKDLIRRDTVIVTRPRRWGKSLNLNMLQSFFQPKFSPEGNIIEDDEKKKNFAKLLIGSEILPKNPITGKKEITKIIDLEGTLPVVSFTFDNVIKMSQDGVDSTFISTLRQGMFLHKYLLNSPKVSNHLKNIMEEYIDKLGKNFSRKEIKDHLMILIESLNEHHNRKVVLLIDEYDKTLVHIKSESPHLYDYACNLYRETFSFLNKNTEQVQLSVFTGVSRIANDDIFSGINKIYHDSVLNSSNNRTNEHYGFTEAEVDQLVNHVVRISKLRLDKAEIKQKLSRCYNGYNIQNTLIYNPWSVMNCLDRVAYGKKGYGYYWINSGNETLITDAIKEHRKNKEQSKNTKKIENKIETLIKSGEVEFTPTDATILDKTYTDQEALLTLMLDAGYITSSDNKKKYRIPNNEVRYQFFTSIVKAWFSEKELFLLNATIDQNEFEDPKLFIKIFQERILKKLKKEEYPEFFFLSMLYACFKNKSYLGELEYRTSDKKKIDILIWPSLDLDNVFIIQVKKKDNNTKDHNINQALNQILEKKYVDDIINSSEQFNSIIIRVVFFEMKKDSKWEISMAELRFNRENLRRAIESFIPEKDLKNKSEEIERKEVMNNDDLFNELAKFALDSVLVN